MHALPMLHRALTALAAVSALLATLTAAAQAPTAERDASPERTLSPYFVVDHAEPGVDALPLKSTAVDVNVSGLIADVRVTQRYRNEGTQPLEARYVFPASTRAAVTALTMRVGNRVVQAQIREKQAARREYEDARQAGKSASLLEQHRPNVFQMSIANLMPGDEIDVELHYSETLVPTDGLYRFVYPTVVGPRYNGAPQQESHRSETWIAQPTLRAGAAPKAPLAMSVELTSPIPVQDLASPTHRFTVDRTGGRNVRATLSAATEHANRDIVLEYRLAGREIASGVLVHEGQDESFFMAMIEPPARVPAEAILPREYVFVLDVSGSMHGFPIETAKTLLRGLVANLRPTDTFNIIPFAGGHSMLSRQSLPATRENVDAATRFVNGQRGSGSTELLAALRAALALPADPDRARSFVVITDGYVSIEKEAMDLIRANLGQANVFAFGIGSSVNRLLIEGLARAGRGEAFVVLNPAQAAVEADRFRAYIEAPLLTKIRVAFRDFDAYDVDPPQLPDLFARRPLVLTGKFRGRPTGTIEVSGQTATGLYRHSIDIASSRIADSDTRALATLWARSRIATLGDYQKLVSDSAAAQDITALGLKYGLLTDYTSFIAVDQVVRNPAGTQRAVDQAQPLPEGVSELAVGAVPSTPEPEFLSMAAAAGALLWWVRRRRRGADAQ
ncbi:MAG TPA: VIT domain-containing protein [Burkholderiaceae bacterium]|nr:VIT domain-containing protein [Burkholderiaceae bacterium]